MAERPFGDGPATEEERAWKAAALAYLIGTDPAGSWGAERDGELAGVAVAIVREALCGISLLVVEPAAQGRGAGRALLARALEHGAGARTALPAARGVREGGLDDLELAWALDRERRGAARGGELEHSLVHGPFRMLVAPDRGYAVVRPGALVLLAARDPEVASALLASVLADAGEQQITVPRLTGDQAWAVDVALAACLDLRRGGALGVVGDAGPLSPYVPSGLWL
jgi:hypothetical protein